MFLRNAWYAAGRSVDFARTLRPVTLLDEAVVVYRTDAGAPVALEDACPHRKLPLSKGELQGDRVICGYHGLTFDRSGRCVAAPTQAAVPSAAKVRSYPAVDKWDLLWLWMGDPAQADARTIVSIDNYANPAWSFAGGGPMDCACNYLYLTDNLLDPSHVSWVHRSSFAASGTENTPLEIKTTPA
jgi:phenylpropionate dioxygenase-like ring-hydroxylating dioxygenase large terminal subunit